MYSLILFSKHNVKDQMILLRSSNFELIRSRYNMFNKYAKHFKQCPRTRNERIQALRIEQKLRKELHKSLAKYKHFSNLLLTHYVGIRHEPSGAIASKYRFFKVTDGLIPNDARINYDYIWEKDFVNLLLKESWQSMEIHTFKYFNQGVYNG